MHTSKSWNRPIASALLALAVTAGVRAAESPIGHWTFDAPADDAARDAAGDRDAKIHGAVPAPGALGGALAFDGKDDYVELGDLGQVASATIAFWMKADDVARPGGWQGLVTSDAWEEGVFHVPLGRGFIDAYLHLGGKRRGWLSSSRLHSGTWYHVAVVADAEKREIRLHLNGREEDVGDLGPSPVGIKLASQVVGREFDGQKPSRYFRGAVDDVRIYDRALDAQQIRDLCPDAPPPEPRDPRNLRTGLRIPDEGYCDQPYTVITADGNWLCTMTTGPGREGDRGQHVVATISDDHGATWSEPVDVEPSDGPEASWIMPLVTPGGRVYGFYTYNGDDVRTWNGKPIRTDTVGWYCYKYSDDHGRTWSERRYRLPSPLAPVDRNNTFGGEHQIFWGIGKPITHGGTAWFAFSRCGALVVDKSEGWFYRSDNVLTEPDPEKVEWQLLPDGDRGLRDPEYGEVHAEQNLVALDDGSLYCMYRTVTGYPFHAYSRDGGHTWTKPVQATYTPGGRRMKTPRACPRIWRCKNGRFLFWYHNHSDTSNNGFSGRNPAWIAGGVERDGFIHWSQPEILLYDPNPNVRTSYPDLIEQDGRYWITETQKTIARVHEIDKTLLEGLWKQGECKEAVLDGYLTGTSEGDPFRENLSLDWPLDIAELGGLSIDFWIRFDELSAGQVILDSRGPKGKGILLSTTEQGTVRIDLSDGRAKAAWDCDPGLLQAGKLHHVVAIVDAGPQIISFVVDGEFCDGGEARTHGWGRHPEPLGDVGGSEKLRVGESLNGQLKQLRIYRRYLRTSEAVANFHAGP